jgi:hypothetical protein
VCVRIIDLVEIAIRSDDPHFAANREASYPQISAQGQELNTECEMSHSLQSSQLDIGRPDEIAIHEIKPNN